MESAKSSVRSIQSLQTKQLTELKCPVCKKYMKPPIYLCVNSHGICENCHELMSECPKCQSSLTDRRSTHLETLSGLILFPCDVCHEEFYLEDLAEHKCGANDEEPTIMCMIGQVYGDCVWKGIEKDVLNHYSSIHPNNYWTEEENIMYWDRLNSSVGIQNIFVIKLQDCTVIVVQKYDSDSQSLQWNASCKCDKGLSDQYIYEIQILGDLETLRFRNVIKDDNDIMMSLPIGNVIIIPIDILTECYLKDNHIITYKLIIHEKSQLEPKPPVIYFERPSGKDIIIITRTDTSDESSKQLKASCGQKTWNSVVDCYMYVKKKLTWS